MKQKTYRRALIVLACMLVAVAICVTMLAQNFMSARAAAANDVTKFRAEAVSAADAFQRANDLNEELMEEGMVLLKNKSSLPLKGGAKISVLGKSSVNPLYGGAGSSSGGAGIYDVYDSLHNAGFVTNPTIKAFYKDNTASGTGRPASGGVGQLVNATGETPKSSYTQAIANSFANYSDAAIVYLTRVGGEGFDLSTMNIASRTDKTEHYLELDDNEKDLIDYATQHFANVVVVLNVSTSMELGDLEKNDDVGSILWMGLPGGSGLNALGRVLNGTVNPSGRTVDTYAADFTKAPTFQNFAVNNELGNQYKNESNGNASRYVVEYDEGIYMGYRYYETRGFIEDNGAKTYTWYKDNVVYPFGFGLSYTTFDWDVTFKTEALSKTGNIEASVKVTNTGNFAGKDVVQMYFSAPYYAGEIEKAHAVLGGFEKTGVLQPGASETVMITMPVEIMASYDYNDANNNSFSGYELDTGTYTVYVGKNAHDSWTNGDSKSYTLVSEIKYEKDSVTNYKVENRFNDVSGYFDETLTPDINFSGVSSLMSRNDFSGTFPKAMTADELKLTAAEIALLDIPTVNAAFDAGKPWFVEDADMPTYQTTRVTGIMLTELIGKGYNDPLWDDFLDQLTIADLAGFVANGFFDTYAIASLGVPRSWTPDGPTGFVSSMGVTLPNTACFYAAPIVVASAWNKKLAEKQGKVMGEEGIWSDLNGMYAPATNTHRTPFSGRNFEYYSEDGLLAGKMAAANVKGLQSKGVFALVKHFAVNDQETSRDSGGLVTWATEQTIREIYLKSFEYAVKEAGAMGMMSSFNRIGTTWAGASYALLTEILRNEWGFTGAVITDWAQGGYMNQDQMIRAGNDFYLGMKFGDFMIFGTPSVTQASLTATHVTALRKASKNVLYTVANSNAMNKLNTTYASEFTSGLALGSFNKGDAVSFNAASANYSGFTYNLAGAPKGVSINSSTGAISGTIANDAIAGDYKMTTSIIDAKGHIGQGITLTLFVSGGLTYTGVTSATVYVGQPANVDVSSARGGTDISYEISNGTLPDGLGLTATGKIVGRATSAGSSTVKVKATADGQTAVETTVTITVMKTISYTGSALASGKFGTAYTANVATASGATGITYTATGLPAGLSLSAAGSITGTPAEVGTFIVEVTASADNASGKTAGFTLTIDPLTIGYEGSTLAAGKVGTAYTASVAAASGATGITYTATGLPAGLSIDANGSITGTPTESGTFTITVTANANNATSKTVSFTVTIEEKPKGGCGGEIGSALAVISIFSATAAITFILARRKSKSSK